MKQIETKNFILNYQNELENFIQDSLSIFEQKKSLITNLFDNELKEKIKASFFVNRKDFVDYIKKISGGCEPPDWATGCFYNNEIQILIDVNNPNEVEFEKHTLTHELVHLYFNNIIYNKFDINRIRWLDESFAGFIDGANDKLTISEYKNIAKKLASVAKMDVNILDDTNKVTTNKYNGYDMFDIIGKYIFDNNLAKQYLENLKTNYKTVRKLGKTILYTAICYIKNL